ncbi:hypothetical protein PanWU01x14_274320 [Parasponia andersonii]|uniref:Uncharacterized protein n=1 Tax=Parasponia andersonii TaxID=3476 RepID=A0A2P5B3R3_PARAD|nr:hypothetical protein PanWU01x14_274320 [Parasponia andersonii]
MVNSMCAVPLDLAPSKVVAAISEGLVIVEDPKDPCGSNDLRRGSFALYVKTRSCLRLAKI